VDDVADDGHDHDSTALRAAAERWWPDVPRASGAAIAWALTRLGLKAHLGGPDHIVVMRGRSASAIVPLESTTVHPAIVRAILHTLRISVEELAAALAADAGPAP